MNAREILSKIGVGEFNATQVIPYFFLTPSATDADMPPIIVLVEALQRHLREMGADVRVDGILSVNTASAFRALLGQNWPRMPWYRIAEAVMDARRHGTRLHTGGASLAGVSVGADDLGFLPDVPCGLKGIALALAGFYLYRRYGRKGR